MTLTVVSGGQTGVDRAALDAAFRLGLACTGWCPRDRRAEDGAIDGRYPLRETPSQRYAQRTLWNVRDSDATLILHRGPISGGTAYTRAAAEALGRPLLIRNLSAAPDARSVRAWLAAGRVGVLNVAGPRESGDPGIYAAAFAFLVEVLGPAT